MSHLCQWHIGFYCQLKLLCASMILSMCVCLWLCDFSFSLWSSRVCSLAGFTAPYIVASDIEKELFEEENQGYFRKQLHMIKPQQNSHFKGIVWYFWKIHLSASLPSIEWKDIKLVCKVEPAASGLPPDQIKRPHSARVRLFIFAHRLNFCFVPALSVVQRYQHGM